MIDLGEPEWADRPDTNPDRESVGLTSEHLVGPLGVGAARLTTAFGMPRGAAAIGGLSRLLSPGGAIATGLAALAGGLLLAKNGADKAAESVARLQGQMEDFGNSLAGKSGEALQALERQAEARLESLQDGVPLTVEGGGSGESPC